MIVKVREGGYLQQCSMLYWYHMKSVVEIELHQTLLYARLSQFQGVFIV